MSEIKLISPLLDNFCIGDPISDQNGVRCCPAMKENEDDRYILKVVSIPASQTKLDALLLAGAYADAEAAKGYFKELTDGVVSELEVLKLLSEQEGYLPVLQWQVVPMEDNETGFDVYMLTSYKRTLKRQFYKEPLTHLNAVNLGLDICAALAACRRAGYLYVDLKPTNIFVTEDKAYKISDLGFMKLDSLQYASLPSLYRSAYTAPEVDDAFSALSSTMDIYALGLILYQAYNNGALPFDGDTAPKEVFPAPDYADYEMSEIILKACDPDPDKRWQDPVEMGQAIVGYMQRNGANDTPIVPPVPVYVPEPVVEDITAEDPSSEAEAKHIEHAAPVEQEASDEKWLENLLSEETEDTDAPAEDDDSEESENTDIEPADAPSYNEDSLGNFNFLPELDDEELTELGIDQESYTELSDDVTEILEQADDLATHQVPDMESVVEECDAEAIVEAEAEVSSSDEVPAEDEPSDDAEAENEDADYNEDIDSDGAQQTMIFEAAEDQSESAEEETAAEEPVLSESEPAPEKKRKRGWLKFLIAILIILGLAAGGYCAYKYYYIKTIDSITLDGKLDTLTVSVVSDADPSLLTVYCIGNGNRTPAELVNGKASFSNLDPDQRYTIEVEIDGFHGLSGKTSATYYTPSQVALEALQIKVGEADGSAMISFTTKKPYNGKWNVEYVTEGEDSKKVVSETGNITLNNLTVGKTYEITITPEDDQNWVTNNTCTFTALPLILAQNVTVADYKDGNLNLIWQAPEGTSVATWTVHCYNDTDYNKTVTVSDCSATFDGLDPMKSYTVEIYAQQQYKGQVIHIDDATLPIDNFTAKITENNFIELSWTCAKEMPAEGWIISYSMNGTEQAKTFTVTENALVFKEVIPEASYVFTITAGNGAPVIATDAEITAPAAENYSSNYDNVPVSKDNITLKMCTPPDSESWSYKSLYSSDYTTKLKVGEKGGFVTRITKYYSPTNESDVFVLFVIRDEEGNIVMYNSEELVWAKMWNYYYGALTIPELPAAAGKYNISIYFNGGFVGSQDFEITE